MRRDELVVSHPQTGPKPARLRKTDLTATAWQGSSLIEAPCILVRSCASPDVPSHLRRTKVRDGLRVEATYGLPTCAMRTANSHRYAPHGDARSAAKHAILLCPLRAVRINHTCRLPSAREDEAEYRKFAADSLKRTFDCFRSCAESLGVRKWMQLQHTRSAVT